MSGTDGVFMRDRRACAFSLVELLTVMAIVALLAALTLPGMIGTLRASKLGSESLAVSDLLGYARQMAISRNLPVEVRFFQLPDFNESPSASPKVWRAVQAYVIDGASANPLTRPRYLSSPVIFSSDTTQSGMLTMTSQTSPVRVGGYGNPPFVALRFKPDGSAIPASGNDPLSRNNSFLTLVMEGDRSVAQGANFATLQIDPLTGRVQIFRP
ncbi:hypothetical protein DB345_10205 [Spartobacteria bacterium LR76]|nr:hypothetical protein DB345_10205 [Spartobacteria bacterium LR76]